MGYKFEKIKILLVEDNKLMLDLIRSILQTFGVTNIILAENGNDAYEKLCAENPDLVITDWMMQPCDGISLSRRIRSDRRSPNPFVPIILMTGFSEKRRVLSARDSGITEFLVKPFNVRDLYKRISEIIENPRQFVRSEDFFGPDRRRKSTQNPEGFARRKTDKKTSGPINPEDIDFIG